MEDVLLKIEERIKYVNQNSKYVKINYQKLDEVVRTLEITNTTHWLDSNPFNILEMDYKDIINFLLVLHTIGDYCFWGEPKWTIKTVNGNLDGSYAMMYLLINRMKKNKDFNMSYGEFKEFLKGNTQIPLLEDRYNNLEQMNNFLIKNNSDFYSLIKDISNDTVLFKYITNNLNYFKDESLYKGEKIYFYKRAQLLVSDILHVREKIEKVKVDYNHLVGCADYKIPQVMRCFGILEFNDELRKIVDEKIELLENSEMEIEIRANTLMVIDYISKKIGSKIARMDINDYIWLLGQNKTKMVKPYHRTLTKHY